ncbi:MAG TPA: class I SAM-dependent methyltransferase [Elusimicrobiales bacterium]|nr:class I SAM-dependent methyltransferase [Elusimicrobiales bacterium]
MDRKTIAYYDLHADQLAAQYTMAEAGPFHLLLRRWLPPGGRVLEIGCGIGRESVFMAALGCKVVATDACEKMLTHAGQAVRSSSFLSAITLQAAAFPAAPDNPLLKENFDAIVASAVIMHIPDAGLHAFISQARGLLRDKGVFICSFCTSREVPEGDTRLFVIRPAAEVQLFFEYAGFRLLHSEASPDSLARNISWTTLVFSRPGHLRVGIL